MHVRGLRCTRRYDRDFTGDPFFSKATRRRRETWAFRRIPLARISEFVSAEIEPLLERGHRLLNRLVGFVAGGYCDLPAGGSAVPSVGCKAQIERSVEKLGKQRTA
jgi:hypothetical protein